MRRTGSIQAPDLSDKQPWERLSELIDAGGSDEVLQFLASLPPGEPGRALSRLGERERRQLLAMLPPGDAAYVLDALPDAQAVEMLEELTTTEAAAIVDKLPSSQRADLLGELETSDAEAILERMEPRRATEARKLLSYDSHTAGGIMLTEYLVYRENMTVGEVLQDLRDNGDRYSDYSIQYAYVVDGDGRLLGVLRLRDLLLRPAPDRVGDIMLRDPLRVGDSTQLEDLKRFFDEHAFVGVPVVDSDERLVGVVRRALVEEAIGQRATRTFLQMAGLVGEDEIRTMPIKQRASRRLGWLSTNIGLNVVAASVIALYQDTIAAVIVLAVFLPIISDMAGNSGHQAVAVSIRELTLGLIRPYEYLRVLRKEISVGVINGLVLGLLLGATAFLWKGNVWLGIVVGGALFLNTILSGLLGGVIPLALKGMKMDPALASGPILTTITDMAGFLMVLSFASMMLPRLVM